MHISYKPLWHTLLERDMRKEDLCPVCRAKTRLQLLRETELKAFPLFCPKCKCESIIDAKNFIIEAKNARR